MASRSMKNNKMPHFFKVILDHTIRDKKLVPTGVKWKVELVKTSAEEIWLQRGWPEFVEYYSIAYGSFLVFEYENNNGDFNVIIFDKTCTEINYPSIPVREQVPNVVQVSKSFQAEVSSYNLIAAMAVPRYYIENNVKRRSEIKAINLRLKVNNKSKWWLVKLVLHEGRGLISAGWLKFARDNVLKVGDVCIFEPPVNDTDPIPLVNVFIRRG
ncbi:B3 domain-containing protein REM9-like isoform X2 [Euphorbia lathyris]|uniref:B3 domain-containing protein REM9-like isoform X2 n=1 Tax=Euphorbia lathyris TaxID=212925 RepID=UPI0033140B64